MKKAFLYILLGAALLLAGERSFRTYQWKQDADVGIKAAVYLFGPSGVIGPDGKELSRQQIFDAYMHKVIEQSPGFSFAESAK